MTIARETEVWALTGTSVRRGTIVEVQPLKGLPENYRVHTPGIVGPTSCYLRSEVFIYPTERDELIRRLLTDADSLQRQANLIQRENL